MDELYSHKKIKAFLAKYNKNDWKDIILHLSLIGLKQVVNQRVYSIEGIHKMSQEKEGVTSLNKTKANKKVVQKIKRITKDSQRESLSQSSDNKNNSIVKDSNINKEEDEKDNSIEEDQPKQNAIGQLPNEDLPIKSEQHVESINENTKPKEEEKKEIQSEVKVEPEITKDDKKKPSNHTYESRNIYPTDYSYCDISYKRAYEESRAFRSQLLQELNYDYTQSNIENNITPRYSLHNTYTYQLNNY